ncbi:hypothetical protein [Candidatus Leptofilum sp.]|uniref:hypothetical protein n=1 Tax=Candidatus Leptofilum sp. TaxID=3241576 RepID=UPI003B5C85A9
MTDFEWNNTRFANYDCVQMQNGSLSLWVTSSVGPRIIGLALHGGDNLFAALPEAHAMTPAGQRYNFRGGHRLWHAPEDPERTYVPDDDPVTVTAVSPQTITFTQPTEPLTGIQKSISVTLPDASATVLVEHTLINRGKEPVTLAPWGITQLKTGGFAILPQSDMDTGLLPNRRLAFWPYARLDSPRVQLGNRFIFVQAIMTDEKFKVGWANQASWLAYWVDDTLFMKEAAYQDEADYYDFGSSSECYCDDFCLELETLGPRTILASETAVSHQERWRVFADVQLEPEETAVQATIARLREAT